MSVDHAEINSCIHDDFKFIWDKIPHCHQVDSICYIISPHPDSTSPKTFLCQAMGSGKSNTILSTGSLLGGMTTLSIVLFLAIGANQCRKVSSTSSHGSPYHVYYLDELYTYHLSFLCFPLLHHLSIFLFTLHHKL